MSFREDYSADATGRLEWVERRYRAISGYNLCHTNSFLASWPVLYVAANSNYELLAPDYLLNDTWGRLAAIDILELDKKSQTSHDADPATCNIVFLYDAPQTAGPHTQQYSHTDSVQHALYAGLASLAYTSVVAIPSHDRHRQHVCCCSQNQTA